MYGHKNPSSRQAEDEIKIESIDLQLQANFT